MNIKRKLIFFSHYPHLIAAKFRKIAVRSGLTSLLGSGRSFLPATVMIIPTLTCNLNCITCGLRENLHNPDQLPPELNPFYSPSKKEVLSMADAVAGFRPSVQIGGGEPFLYKHIDALLYRLIRDHQLFVNVLTNGIFLDQYTELIFDTGVPLLTISIDGFGKTFDKIRGSGNFEKWHNSVIQVIQAKKKYNKNFPRLNAVFVVTPQNQNDLVSTLRYVMDLGFDSFHIQHMINITPEFIAKHNEYVSDDYDKFYWIMGKELSYRDMNVLNLKAAITKAKRIVHQYPGRSLSCSPDLDRFSYEDYYSEVPLAIEKRSRCNLFYTLSIIYPDGSVIPSCGCYFHVMGNIFEESFKSIWNGKAYRFLRKRQRENGWIPVCDKCFIPYGQTP